MVSKDHLFHHNSSNQLKSNQRICLMCRNQEEMKTITIAMSTFLISNHSHKIKEITLMYLKIIIDMALEIKINHKIRTSINKLIQVHMLNKY